MGAKSDDQAAPVAAGATDRRAAERRDRIFYVDLEGRNGMYRGMVLNISCSGALVTIADPAFVATMKGADFGLLGLRLAAMFGEGLRLRFRGLPVRIDAEIARLEESMSEDRTLFGMGLRFLRELTPAECAIIGIAEPRPDSAVRLSAAAPDGALPGGGQAGQGAAPVASVQGEGAGAAGGAGTAVGGPGSAAGVSGQAVAGASPASGGAFSPAGEGGAAGGGEEAPGEGTSRIVILAEPPRSVGDEETAPVLGQGWLAEEVPPAAILINERGAPITLEGILREAVSRGATDVHIKAGSPVRMRIDGDLVALGHRPLTGRDTRALARHLVTGESLERFARWGDLDIAHSVEDLGRFRVNVFVSCGDVGFAIRRIPRAIPTLDALELSPACRGLAELRRGLVLVTGPTGSGKTTTLAAMIDHINRTRSCHILTMEDPIEYRHREIRAHITPREIGRDTVNFAAALKRALRQDPDVMMVGELRDLETIGLAVTAAETGHLVFGTLHTTSAVQTVDRIIDVFPASQQEQVRMQLADSLQGVLSQVLLPRINGGVVAAQEVLIATSAVRALIREGKSAQIENILQTSGREGMQLLDASLARLVLEGIVAREVALSFARDPRRLHTTLTAGKSAPPAAQPQPRGAR